MRRFFAMFSPLSLGTIGRLHRSRPAAAASDPRPALTRYATTDCARLTESC